MAECLREKLEIDATHIDEYGHVNYKSHPLLLERFQDLYMERVVGLSFPEIQKRFGLLSIVRAMNVNYSGQLCKGDVVDVNTKITRVGDTSFTLSQEILKDNTMLTSLDMVVVMCDEVTRDKSTIPEELRKRLSK